MRDCPVTFRLVSGKYWIETLGCPKNQVDSDKLGGMLTSDGMAEANDITEAELIVVNTCAFIESARQESIDTILALTAAKADGARVVVTGCMAERYGDELAAALPEVAKVAGFGVSLGTASSPASSTPVSIGSKRSPKALAAGAEATAKEIPSFDLLNLKRPKVPGPWAYVKVAEGCDRNCGFCAIPNFRGPQRSRSIESILEEVEALEVEEVVLVAQDLASYGKDEPDTLGAGSIVKLIKEVDRKVSRTRLLYLYPSDLTDALVDQILRTEIPYFDLSLQHVSKEHLRRMRRWGDGSRFLKRIEMIRSWDSEAAFRSNFIVGYPGETEEDHDQLLRFVEDAQLDWCGFFEYSREEGTFAYDMEQTVPESLAAERLAELTELQDRITASRRDSLIGTDISVLVDEPGIARSHREAPEIDGIVNVPLELKVGGTYKVRVQSALGPDLTAA